MNVLPGPSSFSLLLFWNGKQGLDLLLPPLQLSSRDCSVWEQMQNTGGKTQRKHPSRRKLKLSFYPSAAEGHRAGVNSPRKGWTVLPAVSAPHKGEQTLPYCI